MKHYQLTPAADSDLDEIWQHVAHDSGVAAADKLEDELHEMMLKLAEMPGMGHLREDLADEPLHFFPVHRFLIIYRRDIEPLQVIRVLHGARDVQAILESDPRH